MNKLNIPALILLVLVAFSACEKEESCTLQAHASSNGPINSGETIELSGYATEERDYPNWEYKWTGPNNFTSDERNVEIPAAGLNNAGEYIFTVTGDLCESKSIVNVIVNKVKAPCVIPDNTAQLSSGLPQFQFTNGGHCRLDATLEQWVMNGSDKNGQLTIIFSDKTAPTGNQVYKIVGNTKPVWDLKADEVQLRILVGFGSPVYYGQSGSLYVDVINGNVSATFCETTFKEPMDQKFTASGNLICQ